MASYVAGSVWLSGWLAIRGRWKLCGSLCSWLGGWLSMYVVGWLSDRCLCGLPTRLAGYVASYFVDWLPHWLASYIVGLAIQVAGWLAMSLACWLCLVEVY